MSDQKEIKTLPDNINNVAFPLGAQLQFPEKCICCPNSASGNKYEYNTNSFSKIFGDLFGASYIVKVPCCKECVPSFHRKKIIPEYLMLVIMLSTGIGLVLLNKFEMGSWLSYGSVAIVFILLILAVFKLQSRTEEISIHVSNDLMVFCFKDHDMAKEFFDLNLSIMEKTTEKISPSSIKEGDNPGFSWTRVFKGSLIYIFFIVLVMLIWISIGSREIEQEYEVRATSERVKKLSKELASIDSEKEELWFIANSVGEKGIPELVRASDESEGEFKKRFSEIMLKFAVMDRSLLRKQTESQEEFKKRFDKHFELKKESSIDDLTKIKD